jgi:F1F0 ATPase subunit 2
MNEIIYVVLVFMAGVALGVLFFGGLWLTVKRMATSKKPAFLFFVSFCLRMAVVLIGFDYVAPGNLRGLLICLLGFIAARFMVVRYTRTKEVKQTHLKT